MQKNFIGTDRDGADISEYVVALERHSVKDGGAGRRNDRNRGSD